MTAKDGQAPSSEGSQAIRGDEGATQGLRAYRCRTMPCISESSSGSSSTFLKRLPSCLWGSPKSGHLRSPENRPRNIYRQRR
jgi:hypothetical protein